MMTMLDSSGKVFGTAASGNSVLGAFLTMRRACLASCAKADEHREEETPRNSGRCKPETERGGDDGAHLKTTGYYVGEFDRPSLRRGSPHAQNFPNTLKYWSILRMIKINVRDFDAVSLACAARVMLARRTADFGDPGR